MPSTKTRLALLNETYRTAGGAIDALLTDTAGADAGPITGGDLTMATSRVLGRTTAATGAIEELTITQVLDLLTGAAQGDVIYRGAAAWDNLAPGTSGHFLKTQGAGANPVWAAVGAAGTAWALAGTGQTATGVYDFAVDGAKADVDFTGLGTYNELLVIGKGIALASSGTRNMRVSTDNGSTFYSTSGDYINIDSAGVEANTTSIGGHSTSTTAARSFIIHILNMKGVYKIAEIHTASINRVIFGASASDLNAIRIFGSGGGNITGGTVTVYAR